MSKDKFAARHNGPRQHEISKMLETIGVESLDTLIKDTVPSSIMLDKSLNLPDGLSEDEYLAKIKNIASKNKIYKSYIGLGYYGTILPSVIQRNIFENPVWYTSYTPYQAEISQGRLEALLNFQTAIIDLTGMEIANASLLDEATAASEAMIMMYNKRSRTAVKNGANILFVDENIFPQTLDVILSRSIPLGVEVQTGKFNEINFNNKIFGAIVQYPAANGQINDYSDFVKTAHENEILVTVAADIMSLAILTPPGEWDADIVVGNTQRFGIPMGYGGPHAGYFATSEKFKRSMPGRIIGVSIDMHGNPALRMALQTREQHIKRERATSNICTAQALLATMAGMYAVYHGAEGLKRIANHIHNIAGILSENINKLGYIQKNKNYFDTLEISLPDNVKADDIKTLALENEINFWYPNENTVLISIDETSNIDDVNRILNVFAKANNKNFQKLTDIPEKIYFDNKYLRKTEFLKHSTYNKYRSETEIMRYMKKLEKKDISLTHSMMPLGSCTMKLNSANSMLPMSWIEFGNIHPFVPEEQAEGYTQIISELEQDLCEITGFDAISFQPNSGASGEYTGLAVIKQYHINRGEEHRNVVLIPSSAHGTNPASAVMAGNKVVVVACDEKGNVNVDDLRDKAKEHKDDLNAFMITYPSTHGVFEEGVKEIIKIIHDNGGLVYMDGANMNAQVGLTNPGIIGADVCHLNLHKTFAIPHGGGGPGVGPIGVAKHLVEFLPSHPVVKTGGKNGIYAVSAAPYGSASVLAITHAYIKMMGGSGLTEATKIAILNANYLAVSLKNYYSILYTGSKGKVAHEMILDCRNFKQDYDIESADIARRLMDYGFHAPTLSFPVHETLMVEPTESESLQELDRFIECMISIKNEIEEIKQGKADKTDNVLKNAPHTAEVVINDKWEHNYSRKKAAFPLHWIAENKFWVPVGKIDSGYGDRNLVCCCVPIEEFKEQ
ncbi:MAG: aminomethyl-transferring glycine dehydrogenase [Bacteroidales bacterium]|nr:aminomethyl-transferring glycine dehydrogenase [Bacteroidales bacterium]